MKIVIRFFIMNLLLIVLLVSRSNAQITLTANDAPTALGTRFEMSTKDDVTVNVGESGANKYWDFSSIDFSHSSIWEVVDPETTPFKNKFPDANLVYKSLTEGNDTITYNYAKITENDLTELGLGGIVGTEITEILAAKRATPKLTFPVTYGMSSWSSVLEADTLFGIINVTIVDSSYNTVDAYGTIKTAMGEFPCLRIRQNHVMFVDLGFSILELEKNIVYFWGTSNYGILATVSSTHLDTSANFTLAKSVNIMTNFMPTEVAGVQKTVPYKFELMQNYPNPFNPGTTFSYYLKEPAFIKLRIVNIAGEVEQVLVHEKQMPGHYQVEWNAGNYPSGVYYYQLQAGNDMITKKCTLLK